ncbi:MAG: AraC family transcriptional regulator ligand-binding domain-containing protein [Pseudomonadota bacterium]
MGTHALTRASTIGPIADVIEAAGGSVSRVFRSSELPFELVARPDSFILLSDQLRLVENAAREIGDDALAARLSTAGGIAGLGPYGQLVLSFDTLGWAINAGYQKFASLLQAATQMDLVVRDGFARWSYRITAPIIVGRQRNEILAIGYMLNLLRHFAGPRWTPDAILVPGLLQGRGTIEDVFAASVTRGESATVVFPAELLDAPNPARRAPPSKPDEEIPGEREFVGIAEHMIRLGLLEGGIGIDQIAARLSLSRRTFQRRLAARDVTFEQLADGVRLTQARDKLAAGRAATAIALELGYSDPAHFSRAFRRWTGETPRRWRVRHTSQ